MTSFYASTDAAVWRTISSRTEWRSIRPRRPCFPGARYRAKGADVRLGVCRIPLENHDAKPRIGLLHAGVVIVDGEQRQVVRNGRRSDP